MNDKEKFIEKELAEKQSKMKLDAHNKTTLRSILGKEFDYWERQVVREDNHTDAVEGYYENREY